MEFQMTSCPIDTVALIKNVNCPRNCQYCYERQKTYSKKKSELSYEEMISRAGKRVNLSGLQHIMIDYNEDGNPEKVANKKIIVTTTPQGLIEYDEKYKIIDHSADCTFNISIHNQDDMNVMESLRMRSDVQYITIMISDLMNMIDRRNLVNLCIKYYYKIYIMIDKFSSDWKNYDKSYKSFNKSLYEMCKMQIQHRDLVELDNCVITRLNNQDCPAKSQINIEPDMSLRKCPYYPTEDLNHNCFKGCYLMEVI